MLFSSLSFLYYFLPGVLILYFLVPHRLKNGVLLLASLLFYGWGEPKYLFLMLLTIGLYYASGLAMERFPRFRKGILILSVVLGAALLGVFKYADFFVTTVNQMFGSRLPLLRLSLPVGISFYTFQCISYAADVYRGDTEPQKNFIAFGAYVSMFPQLIAGPIVRYVDVAPALSRRKHSREDLALGLRRFLVGLGKKILLANQLGALTQSYRDSSEPTVLFSWLYAAAFLLQIYYDFSGYSDMAIGLGRIFGFRFPENFDYPYCSRSITEFWRRWHMSLGSWFRDYVYIPLGGSRVSRIKWVRNILVVWMLTGLWHGASWNFVLWGLLFALLLLLEKALPGLKKLPGISGTCYVVLTVMASFVLFNADSLSQAGSDLLRLVGLGGIPAGSTESLYCLRSNLVLLAVSALGATPLPKKLWQRYESRPFMTVLEPVCLLLLLLLSTAYLVDGSFNPFLYFRF